MKPDLTLRVGVDFPMEEDDPTFNFQLPREEADWGGGRGDGVRMQEVKLRLE